MIPNEAAQWLLPHNLMDVPCYLPRLQCKNTSHHHSQDPETILSLVFLNKTDQLSDEELQLRLAMAHLLPVGTLRHLLPPVVVLEILLEPLGQLLVHPAGQQDRCTHLRQLDGAGAVLDVVELELVQRVLDGGFDPEARGEDIQGDEVEEGAAGAALGVDEGGEHLHDVVRHRLLGLLVQELPNVGLELACVGQEALSYFVGLASDQDVLGLEVFGEGGLVAAAVAPAAFEYASFVFTWAHTSTCEAATVAPSAAALVLTLVLAPALTLQPLECEKAFDTG